MKHYLPLLGMIALIAIFLVPYGWFADQSPVLEYLFYVLLHGQLIHTIGHSLLFAGIGSVLLLLIPSLHTSLGRYTTLILVVALAQESLQAIYKGRLYRRDTLGDIVIDLVAAVSVWFIVTRMFPQRAEQERSYDSSVGG